MILLNGNEVKPTIFPDKTSQVWKIPDEFFLENNHITWYWEGNEAELIWVNQLIDLMVDGDIHIFNLHIPYLPYGRQDKEISNETTFAKSTFLSMLKTDTIGIVTTIDAHSVHPYVDSHMPLNELANLMENQLIDVVVFPDAGAYARYHGDLTKLYNKRYGAGVDVVVLDKVRNQLTGKIEDLSINKELSTYELDISSPANMLIVDDLSDYGGTFKKAAKYLHSLYPANNVSLYVTHFLGHGCFASYKESGILNVYTTDTLSRYRAKKGTESDGFILV